MYDLWPIVLYSVKDFETELTGIGKSFFRPILGSKYVQLILILGSACLLIDLLTIVKCKRPVEIDYKEKKRIESERKEVLEVLIKLLFSSDSAQKWWTSWLL